MTERASEAEERRERLLKRAKARKAARPLGPGAGGARAREGGPADGEERDEESARAALHPLLAWFQEDGPLAHFLIGERLLELVPAECPRGAESDTLVRMWTHAAPKLTDARYRREWRDFVVRIEDELGPDVPPDHPDKVALEEARFWIGDRLATGPAALENAFLRRLFELSVEAGHLAGWAPAWLCSALELTEEGIEEEHRLRREERALSRIAYGPLHLSLPRALTPTIEQALERLLTEELDADQVGDAAAEAAARDLDAEGRSRAALAFREAAEAAAAEGRPFAAFDLRAIFELLAEDGPAAVRAAGLLYARAIDAHLAHDKHRIW